MLLCQLKTTKFGLLTRNIMIIPEQFRVIDNQSVLPTFGLEIRVEMFHLEGDMITLHDSVCVTWPMISFCPKTLKIRNQHTLES